MKVLIVTPYFYPSVGGVQNYVLNIALGLKRDHGKEIIIVTSGDDGKSILKCKVKGFTTYRLPVSFKLSNTPFNFAWRNQIEQIIADEKPDIINAHTPVPFMADMAIRAAGDIPTVLTYYNDLTKNSISGKVLARVFYMLLGKKTLRKATGIIAMSQPYVHTSSYLKKWQKKVSIVSPGVDMERFNTNVDKIWLKKKYPGKKIVLFVGSMQKTHMHKGIDILIKAILEIRDSIPNIQLIAAGSGDAITIYEKLAEDLGVSDVVDFSGFVKEKDLARYYAGADVFVLPSTNESEGFGMVLAEAQACGTAVIGSRVGGIPHAMVNDITGLIVSPSSINDLSIALLKLLKDNQLRAKFGTAGVEYIENNFNWIRQVDLNSKLYDSLFKKIIVQVTPSYPPAQGGMELRIRDLSQKLAARGYRTLVLTSDKATSRHKERYGNLSIEYLFSKQIASTPLIPFLLFRILTLPKNTILHVHVAQAFTPEIAFIASRIKAIPIIFHIRLDVNRSGSFGFLLSAYKKYILGPTLRRGSKIIVLNTDYKNLMISKYGISPTNIEIIPNATDFPVKNVQDVRLSTTKVKTLLLVGRLSQQKNISLGIKAVAQLRKNGYSVKLNIAGDGELRSQLENLVIDLDLINWVTFLGRLEWEDLRKAYESADIIVQTSFEEGFSSVLIEAMASGKPLIASNIEGTRNIIKNEHNGLLIDPYSVDTLIVALRRLIDDPRLAYKLVVNGIKDVRQYKWDEIVTSTELVYDSTSL